LRLNAGETATGTIRAYKFGQPLAGFEAPLSLVTCTAHPNEPTSGMPAPTPATPVTGNDGSVTVTFQAGSVPPSMLPRRRAPMGSQVYFWSGEWANRGNVVGNQPASSGQAAKQALFSVLVFQDQGVPPARPTWNEVQPVLAAYARLYPGMTEIFDLSDPNMVALYAGQVAGAIQAPLESPYAMPVTRDMSAYNRQLIVNYVSTISPSASPGTSPGAGDPPRNA
jgi:hypothetical protein